MHIKPDSTKQPDKLSSLPGLGNTATGNMMPSGILSAHMQALNRGQPLAASAQYIPTPRAALAQYGTAAHPGLAGAPILANHNPYLQAQPFTQIPGMPGYQPAGYATMPGTHTAMPGTQQPSYVPTPQQLTYPYTQPQPSAQRQSWY